MCYVLCYVLCVMCYASQKHFNSILFKYTDKRIYSGATKHFLWGGGWIEIRFWGASGFCVTLYDIYVM